MIDRHEIMKYCIDNNIATYSFARLRKASKEANTIEEAISILTASEEKKPVDPDMQDYMAYNEAIRAAEYWAKLAGECGEGISAQDIADAINADRERAGYVAEVRKYLAIAESHYKGACRWARPEILTLPKYFE